MIYWYWYWVLISQFLYLSAQMQSIPNDSRINCLKLHPSRGDPPKDIFWFLKCHKSSFISVWCLKINEACSALIFRDLRDYVKKLFPPKLWQRCTNTVSKNWTWKWQKYSWLLFFILYSPTILTIHYLGYWYSLTYDI